MIAEHDRLIRLLIARTAVNEQVLLTLLTTFAKEFETPPRFAAALLQDVRKRLDTIDASAGPAERMLSQETAALLDDFERRALAMLGARGAES